MLSHTWAPRPSFLIPGVTPAPTMKTCSCREVRPLARALPSRLLEITETRAPFSSSPHAFLHHQTRPCVETSVQQWCLVCGRHFLFQASV